MRRAARRSNSCRLAKWKGASLPLCYYVFDLLQLDGRNLRGLPLTSRKEVLRQLCAGAGDPIRYSGELGDDATALLGEVQAARARGNRRQAGGFALRTGTTERRMDQAEGARTNRNSSSAVTRHRPARGNISARCSSVTTKRRSCSSPARLAPVSITNYSRSCTEDCKPKRAMIVPLLISRQEQGGQWVQGITPAMMRKIQLGESRFCLSGEIRRMDARREVARSLYFLACATTRARAEVRREIESRPNDANRRAPIRPSPAWVALTPESSAALACECCPRRPRRRHRRKGS